MKKSDWLAIMVAIVMFDMIFLWCVDVSASAMISGGFVANGFLSMSSLQTYHIGLYGTILSTLLLAVICIHKIVRD